MALDASKPSNTTLYSKLADYQRETREYVNDLAVTALNKAYILTEFNYTGETVSVGDELENVNLEFVEITADEPRTLNAILYGWEGQIKHFIARDSKVTLAQDKSSTTGGTFQLNSPAGDALALSTNDVVAFVNIGGDGGETSHGYWQELFRTLAV